MDDEITVVSKGTPGILQVRRNSDFDDLEKIKNYWTAWTFSNAARYGDLTKMEWLKTNNCPMDRWTLAMAAQNGNLKNMKWLRDSGCPFDEWCYVYSIFGNNLKNIQWLKEQKCPWSERVFKAALDHGNLEIVKWLKDNECPHEVLYKPRTYFRYLMNNIKAAIKKNVAAV